MKALGNVQEISPTGMLLVRAKFVPLKNAEVFDHKMKTIGKVVRIFGPVRKPYVAIEPEWMDMKTMMNLIGKDVYIKEVNIDGKRKKDRRN